MKGGPRDRVRYALIFSGILFSLLFISLGSGAEFSVDPNVTQYMTNRTFNFTVNNTDPTMNITNFYIFINSSFGYVSGTNGTSSGNSFFYTWTPTLASWQNLTPGALVGNGTTESFWLNMTMPQQQGNYIFIMNLTYSNGTNETKTFNITVNCSQELITDLYLPNGSGYLWGGPVPFYGRVLDACGNVVTGANIIYSIYKNPNMYNRTNTNPTHNSTGQWSEANGWYNFTWSGTDAQRAVGWYNVTYYISKSEYPDNYTFREDAFHLGYQPSLSAASVERTATCPEEHHFNVTVNDADNDYNNITLEIRKWNETGWDNWTVANWTYQNNLVSQNMDFYQNFTNASFLAGLYSYRFYTIDEFNYSDILNGTDNFTINNCTDILSITTVPPTISNGSYSNSSNLTINISFTSANAVNCTLEFNNGTATNYTENATKGWCNFTVMNQPEGLHNYSVWINNTYGNTTWNGTWFIGVDLTDPDNLTFSFNTTTNSTTAIRQDWLYVNATFNDTNPSHCILEVNNGTAQNHTMSGSQNCYLNITGLPTNAYNYSVYAFDLSGRFVWNGTGYVNLDTTPPNMSVNILNISESNVTYNTTSFPGNLQVTTSEAASLCWFSINGTNETEMSNTSQTSWSSPISLQYNGTYVFNISCNDTLGNLNTTNITFNYDNTTPPCTESWVYGNWGLCLGGVQYRTATDLNGCGTTDNRSYLSQGCGNPGGGGGSTVIPVTNTIETKVWGAVLMNSYLTMDITKNAISLTGIGFETISSLTGISIKVERLDEVDDKINLSDDQKLYQYINITSTNIPESSLKNISMDFCVNYTWLDESGVSKQTIKLKRLYEGVWQTIITTPVSDDGKEVCYNSQTPGFSYFAITGDIVFIQPLHEEMNITDNETTPWQEPVTDDDKDILPQGMVCYPGERACVGWNVLQQCNGDGTGWITVTDCFYGCNNAQCNTHLVISIDYNVFWAVIGIILIMLVIWIIHAKKGVIEDFLFWKL